MLAHKSLPTQLKQLLENPNILKVGRLVSADLRYLAQACDSEKPFVGAVDLAKFAKDRDQAPTANVGLADLCALVLRKQLPKNISARISSSWEDENLTDGQIHYSALDAWAALEIYQSLNQIPLPSLLPENPPLGLRVALYNTDKSRIIARGLISSHSVDATYDEINISRTRTVITVEEVIVPGAVVTTHKKRALNAFGPTPFNLVCLISHLRTSVPCNEPAVHTSELSPRSSAPVLDASASGNSTSSTTEQPDVEGNIGDLLLQGFEASESEQLTEPHPRIADSNSTAEGITILQNNSDQEIGIVGDAVVIRSRVLKDVFHVFNMFYISTAHGLRLDFVQALRDALFIPDKDDKRRILAWASKQEPPQTWDYLLRHKSKWLWRHCKRSIPPPEVLYPLVETVFKTYGPLKDSRTSAPLFNVAAWKTAKNVLELIRNGFISDPPGIPLYRPLGADAKAGGLQIYACDRGTNRTEGVHSHLLSRLPASGSGIRHLLACIQDFILRHNLLVCVFA